jgi:signal transduction histidine kinase
MDRILVVDDHEDDRYLVQQILSGRGYEVVCACDGHEAISLARRHPPDLILSDIFMPGMDGYTLCRLVRQDQSLAAIPLMFYTATYVGVENERLALALGADRFLVKPLEPAVLANEISAVLDRARTGDLVHSRRVLPPDGTFHVEYVAAIARKLEEKVAQLEEANRYLTEANGNLERFAFIASHDLREPLRTIISFTQLLARRYRGRLDADADEFIGLVIDAAMRMDSLTRDLLVFSQVGSEGPPLTPIDSGTICAGALDNLHGAINESGATITCGPLPIVLGDGAQLLQLFQNLISNAVKFRRPGTPPTVRVTAEPGKGEWLFTIADDGVGIPETDQDVFEIFRRLHHQRDFPGTGVGLAICKRVVVHHGGRIWIERSPRGGTDVHFTLLAGGRDNGR